MFVCMWVIICNEYNKFLITSSISFVYSGVLLLRDGYMSSSSHGWTSVDLFLMGGLGVLWHGWFVY